MNTSEFLVDFCLKIPEFLFEYGGYSSNGKYMGPYRHVSFAIFL